VIAQERLHRAGRAAAAISGGFGRQCVRKSRCRAFSTRHQSWVRPTEGWRQPSVR
jgi:hypothetical protein